MRAPSFILAAALGLGAVLLPLAAVAQTSTDNTGNADTEKRLQRLEEQMVDLSAHLGTIETMSQNGAAAAAPSAPSQGFSTGGASTGGGDDARLAELETQVRALSAQMSDILHRLDQIERHSGSLSPSQQPSGGGAERNYAGSSSQPTPADRLGAEPAEQGTGFSVGGNEPADGGFGATIEQGQEKTQKSGGLSGYFGGGSSQPAATAGASSTAPVQTASSSSPEARALYEQAYNALVERNYRGAAEDFEKFVASYSRDPLAGQAYFWLGEASFVNGEYRKAADSFLKSSTNYPQNEKAAEALLKLGISLKRLGENKAACSSFAELARRFPRATPVLERAEREKSRAQC